MPQPEPASLVQARWEEAARGPDARALIHPTGAISDEAYDESGLIQAEGLTNLAEAFGLFWDIDPIPILDYGCGDGRVLQWFDRDLFTLHAADSSRTMLQLCAERIPEAQCLANPEAPHWADHFRMVYCLAVLIHLGWQDGQDLVRRMARLVRPGGLLVLDVPLSDDPQQGGSWISVTSWSRAALEDTAADAGLSLITAAEVPWHVLQKAF